MRPVEAKFKITLGYGVKSSLYASGMHKGVDFGCPVGTPVRACTSGTVTAYHWGSAFGTHIVVDCDKFADGTPGLWMGYMHLSRLAPGIVPGKRVKKGQLLGYSGKSGHVTGPHLHVEVQKKPYWNAYRSVNPQKWIDA